VGALWEQAPASAVNTVHKHICALLALGHQLRESCEAGRVITQVTWFHHD
jgi:hypothetical protein